MRGITKPLSGALTSSIAAEPGAAPVGLIPTWALKPETVQNSAMTDKRNDFFIRSFIRIIFIRNVQIQLFFRMQKNYIRSQKDLTQRTLAFVVLKLLEGLPALKFMNHASVAGAFPCEEL